MGFLDLSPFNLGAAIGTTAFNGFLRFNEVADLRGCDVKFCQRKKPSIVELGVAQSKTDICRDGALVLLARIDDESCPFNILFRYVQAANIDLSSKEPIFRSLQIYKSTNGYKLPAV